MIMRSNDGAPADNAIYASIVTAPENRRVLIYGDDEMAMAWKDRLDGKWYYAPHGGLVGWTPSSWREVPRPEASQAAGARVAVMVWPFDQAPDDLQAKAGLPHDGDEDWLALVPRGWEDHDMHPSWAEQGTPFGRWKVARVDLDDGSVILVGGHS